MAKRRAPPLTWKAFRNAREIDLAVTSLTRRRDEVAALKAKRYDDPSVAVAEEAIGRTVCEVFGPDSPECRDYQFHQIHHGATFAATPWDDRDDDRQAGFEAGIPRTVAMLEGLLRALLEKREMFGPAPQSGTKIGGLHPRLGAVADDLYRDGHFAQAVVEAAKALVNMVKERSRASELDGAALMHHVFSVNAPVLAFTELTDQTGRDEQQGMMHLCVGAVLAIRNPRSHENVLDTRDRADEMLGLLSFLAHRLEEAQRV